MHPFLPSDAVSSPILGILGILGMLWRVPKLPSMCPVCGRATECPRGFAFLRNIVPAPRKPGIFRAT